MYTLPAPHPIWCLVPYATHNFLHMDLSMQRSARTHTTCHQCRTFSLHDIPPCLKLAQASSPNCCLLIGAVTALKKLLETRNLLLTWVAPQDTEVWIQDQANRCHHTKPGRRSLPSLSDGSTTQRERSVSQNQTVYPYLSISMMNHTARGHDLLPVFNV